MSKRRMSQVADATLDAMESEDDDDQIEEGDIVETTDLTMGVEQLYFRDIKRYPRLSAEEEVRLGRLVRQGDEKARNTMIECNLLLVVKICMRYRNAPLPLIDMVEEGNLGLIRAVEKFDPELGYRFSTYATWWIRQSVERALMNNKSLVRIPVYLAKKINRYRRTEGELSQRHSDAVDYKQVAEAMGEPVDQVRELLRFKSTMMSIHDEQDRGPFELACDDDEQPENRVCDEELSRLLDSFIGQLTEREREVLTRRYGLNDCECATLEEVSAIIGITRERVRQIQNTAIQRIHKLIMGPVLKNNRGLS